jgi:transposase InsO family protein
LDEGEYIASESSFYRVMADHNQNNRRGRAKQPTRRAKPEEFIADGPNQVWSWDITYCPTQTKGLFYYLYLIMDIYGRDIVGYEVHETECGELGKEVFDRAFIAAGMPSGLVLHSDNGAPMKSFTMQAKLSDLGVTPSYSRPRVSDDNPYSEALFRTLKYCPSWPANGFKDLVEVREWVERFVHWYNKDHRHSKIKFVTPNQRKTGQDSVVLARRKNVLEKAKQKNPKRWSGSTRNCEPTGPVKLNPDKLTAVS